MPTGFLKISSNANKILKSKLMTTPSYMIIFNFSFPFSIVRTLLYFFIALTLPKKKLKLVNKTKYSHESFQGFQPS